MTTHLLTTDRLVLRVPSSADRACYDAFYAVSDLTVGGYRGGRDAAEVDAILRRDIDHWARHGFGMFLIEARNTGQFQGGTGLYLPKGWPTPELTWWLMPAVRGTGVATEASLAVIDWAHDVLNWSRVETMMRDENAPARALANRLAQRCGGRRDRRETLPDGVARDIYVLSERAAA
ncbi:GNAT family N-acetyltransferase [Thalassococcus sp. CAU 1522]|uniref:GNAT family N-acetyltransferase n=1 Tax=Thalassococcus arenae TaxID=2851652 RepID=A0ABS6N6S0_9RHOB|nr:GNAT family N-acetyltransferase [Thalassococcus arenae]MBV2359722.1 GNAT family N-acetyltransferase [Thalassococcus arenae]